METSPSWHPPKNRSLPLNLMSQFLSFIFCPISFWRDWAAFLGLGAWCFLLEIRSCFLEVAQHSDDVLMNLWGRNWSTQPIPLPSWNRPTSLIFHVLCVNTDIQKVLPRELSGYSKHLLPQHKRQLYKWTSPDGQYWNQIDSVLCSWRRRSCIQSVKTRLGADFGQIMNYLLQNSDLKLRK